MDHELKLLHPPSPPISRKKRPATHGAYAKSPTAMQIRAHKVQRLVMKMRNALPYLTEADIPACRAWAEMELISVSLFAAIMSAGAVRDADGDVFARRVVDDHRKVKLAQLAFERELGMTPMARAQLRATDRGNPGGMDLVAMMAAGDAETVEPEQSADSEQTPESED
jgi:hypothetical protein